MRSRFLAFVAAFALMAAPAFAQVHTRTQPASLEQMAAAGHSVELLKAFDVTPEGLRHRASGFLCPTVSFGIALTAIGEGALPGLSAKEAVSCEYSDQKGVVARLAFAKEAADQPVLTQAFCKGLVGAYKLHMGVGVLPGVGKTTDPAQQKILPTVPVAGTSTPLWRCSTIREPLALPLVVADTSGLRAPSGWSVRAVHTPQPPPCCTSYKIPTFPMTFMMQPVLLALQAAGVPPTVLPGVPAIVGLKPGAA